MISYLLRPRESSSTSSLSNPAQWLMDFVGGSAKTRAGVAMDASTALTYSAVFACVRVIGDAMGSMPWRVLKSVPKGRQELRKHRLWPVVHGEFNPEMGAFQGKSSLIHYSLLWGNGYAEIIRNVIGEPIGLSLIESPRVEVVRSGAGDIVYKVRPAVAPSVNDDDDSVVIRSADMFHLRGPGDGLKGWSTIALARDSFGLGLAMERFGATWFGNGARPAGFLKHPGKFDPNKGGAEAIRKSFNAIMGNGPDSAHQVGVLEEDMSYVAVGVPPEDSQFLQSREHQLPEVCRWFNVPPSKIFDLKHAHYRNIEHLSIAFGSDTLAPWAARMEEEADRKLLTREERAGGVYTKFNLNSMMRGDSSTRAAFYKSMRDLGCYSPNMILAKEDENTLGEKGDVLLVPMNMQRLEIAAGIEEPEPGHVPAPPPENAPPPGRGGPPGDGGPITEQAKVSASMVIADAVNRLMRKEINAVGRAVKRPGSFEVWADRWYSPSGEFAGNAREAMESPIVALAQMVAVDHGVKFGGIVEVDTAQAVETISARYIRQSRDQIEEAFASEAIPELFDQWRVRRAAEFAEGATDEIADIVLGIAQLAGANQ